MNDDKKRKQMLRVALTESIMVIAVVVIVALLMFTVMGYSLRTDSDWSVERSGLVQLISAPSGASIQIDGEDIFPRTETSRMMSEGTHTVRLYRSGYDDWEKTITVRPGIFLRLKYPRLFKENRGSETAKILENIAWLKFSDNRKFLLYAEKDSSVWHLADLNSNELIEQEVDTSDLFTGEVTKFEWLSNNEKVLVNVAREDSQSWWIVNFRNPERSVNLTEMFGLNFTSISPLSDAGDRFWVVENGNLRQIYVSNKEVSGVIASGVLSFANDKDHVVYLRNLTSSQRAIETFRDGDNKSVQVQEIEKEDAIVKLALEEYLGDTYLSILTDQKFTGYKADDFPAEGQTFAMEKYLEKDLDILPTTFKASKNGQFVVMNKENNLVVMDAETEQIYATELPTDRYFWVDDYLVGVVADDELTVYDFDGTNRRALAKATAGYPALINADNKWLYYFRLEDDKLLLKREEL